MGYDKFELGDVTLLSGEVLSSAFLAYQTYGKLDANKSNVVVLPTFYTGSHQRNEGFFGSGRAIDPNKHFIVSINMFGNGLSSSPSNTESPQDGPRFPHVSLWDNVACQYRLLTEALGVKRIALVTGWSMAGCQAYQWAAQYPDFVDAILPFCASAKTSPHNYVFLEGVRSALCADQHWNNGDYSSPPVNGLKAFARVYAGWAFSQTFYRESLYKTIGYESFEDLLVDWEEDHAENWDANNLLCKLRTWQTSDISLGPTYQGDFIMALKSIKAKSILMPCTQDLYFPPEDNAIEASHMKHAEFRPFDSPWGHCAANPGNDSDFTQALEKKLTGTFGILNVWFDMTITWQDFEKVDIRIGTIIMVEDFPEARKPAYILHVDFGTEIGIKKSSSQITDLYNKDQLKDKQVMGVVNFSPKQVGPIMSECLVLGFYRQDNSVVLATNDLPIDNGSRLL